jgi:hypothetical protein
MSQGTTVEKWVEFGLGLPQYREAFFRNGVTVLDFPLFLEDDRLLRNDIGVKNRLHRQQMIRSMQSLVLAQGQLPLPALNVKHRKDPDGGVTVSWEPPKEVCTSRCYAWKRSFASMCTLGVPYGRHCYKESTATRRMCLTP